MGHCSPSHWVIHTVHGPVQASIRLVPWVNCTGPWVNTNVYVISHGMVCLSHGLHETWTRTILLRCNLGEWDIMRYTDPSHRCLHTAHGPGMCCITLFPWVQTSCPWVCTNVYVISHGLLALPMVFMRHGPGPSHWDVTGVKGTS